MVILIIIVLIIVSCSPIIRYTALDNGFTNDNNLSISAESFYNKKSKNKYFEIFIEKNGISKNGNFKILKLKSNILNYNQLHSFKNNMIYNLKEDKNILDIIHFGSEKINRKLFFKYKDEEVYTLILKVDEKLDSIKFIPQPN